jgi:hypothetical protein
MALTSELSQKEHAQEFVTPERSLIQCMDALGEANRIRSARAKLKKDLKAGQKAIDDIILRPPEYILTMKLFDLVIACPKYGRVKVNKILVKCRISSSKTIGDLSLRQRAEIIDLMKR